MPTFEVEFKPTNVSDWESYQEGFIEFKCKVERILGSNICPTLYKKPVVKAFVRQNRFFLKIQTCCYEYSKTISKLLHDYQLK